MAAPSRSPSADLTPQRRPGLYCGVTLLTLLIGCTSVIPVQPEAVFSARILDAGLASSDPWAGAHLMLAFPAAQRLSSLRSRWVDLIQDDRARIPLHGDDGHRGEQHPHLMLRTAAWVLPSTHTPHLKDRIERALARKGTPTSWQQINDLAWLIEAAAVLKLAATTPTVDGDLASLARILVAAVEESDQVVKRCLEQGDQRPDGMQGPAIAGTWAYTCGGMHLLSALAESVDAGYLQEADQDRVIRSLLLMTRRLSWELQFRLDEEQRALAAGISPRRAARHAVLAGMKLAGHGLDLLGRCRALDLLTKRQVAEAADSCLVAASQVKKRLVEEVDPSGILLSGDTQESDTETWERAFGDGCHLLRGLVVWHSNSLRE